MCRRKRSVQRRKRACPLQQLRHIFNYRITVLHQEEGYSFSRFLTNVLTCCVKWPLFQINTALQKLYFTFVNLFHKKICNGDNNVAVFKTENPPCCNSLRHAVLSTYGPIEVYSNWNGKATQGHQQWHCYKDYTRWAENWTIFLTIFKSLLLHTMTQKGVPNIKMFISLHGVRPVCWMLPHLSILCISQWKHTALKTHDCEPCLGRGECNISTIWCPNRRDRCFYHLKTLLSWFTCWIQQCNRTSLRRLTFQSCDDTIFAAQKFHRVRNQPDWAPNYFCFGKLW